MAHRTDFKLDDDDFYQELVNYIEVGNYIDTACAAMGINKATYYRWLARGQEVEERVEGHPREDELKQMMRDQGVLPPDFGVKPNAVKCWLFLQDITRASARSEAFAVAMVRKHMPDQWTAAMTFLERRFPGRWKRKEQIDIGEHVESGIDETLLLTDPTAVSLIHDALEAASKQQGQIEPAVIDAVVVEEATVTSPAQDDEKPPHT